MDTSQIKKFHGSFSPLSNFYEGELVWEGLIFPSAEHAYQYAKLQSEGITNPESILKIKKPVDVMYYARKCLPFCSQNWFNDRVSVMKAILIAKFNYCHEYREEISKYDKFVEDTGNKFWGIGNNGQGQNMLGKLHEIIKKERKLIFLVGSSHMRNMDNICVKLCTTQNIPVSIDLLCIPGGRIVDMFNKVLSMNISHYDFIVMQIGSNDLYTKTGMQLLSPSDVILKINAVKEVFHSNCIGKVIVSPLLPRMESKYPSSLPFSHFVHYNCKVSYINKCVTSIRIPFLWRGQQANPNILTKDGVHLNYGGKLLLASKWVDIFRH